MPGVSEDFTWAGRLVGGSVVRAERQGARRHGGRPAWYVDVQRDGERIGCYARMQRPQNNDEGAALLREFELLRALAAAGVKVPEVYGFSTDPIGILMECLPGEGDYLLITEPERRRSLDHQFLAELVQLHQADVQPFVDLGMAVPSSPAEYVTLDLDVWEGMYRATIREPVPLLEFTCRWLRRHIPPPPQRPVLVQGDTGPGQYMFHGDRMVGIIDWEFAHIGDPMLDLALIRGRDFYNPGADLRDWFQTYEELGGAKIDWAKLAYYTVKAMAITPLSLAGLCQDMFPGTDHAEWYAETATYGRATAQALAEAVGVTLGEVELPKRTPGRVAGMFDVLEDNLGGEFMPADEFGRYRMGLALRLVHMMRNADGLDRQLVALELDDLAGVLGHRPGDLRDGDRELNALVAEEDLDREAELVAYFWRRTVREEELLRGALGAGEGAVLIPIEQLR